MSKRPALGDISSRANIAGTQNVPEHVRKAQALLAKYSASDIARAEQYFKTGDYKACLAAEKAARAKPSAATSTSAGNKRKAQDAPTQAEIDDIDVDGMVMDKSCNQVRGHIRRFIESGEMKTGEFANAIGVSTPSLSNFLGQNGTMKGAGSATYSNAWAFFKRRELAGVKMPTKKAKIAAPAGASGSSVAKAVDISDIRLPGEDQRDVEVYDTCDEVRKKINAHLVKPGVTQAQFCRDITELLYGSGKIQSKQLSDFRGKKGPRAGNSSSVFYAAYVYFEKQRIAEGKPKSKHRIEMEDAWPTGFDLIHRANQKYIVPRGSVVYEDKLGRVTSSWGGW